MKILLALLFVLNNFTVVQSRNLTLNGAVYYTVYKDGECIADDLQLEDLIELGKENVCYSNSQY